MIFHKKKMINCSSPKQLLICKRYCWNEKTICGLIKYLHHISDKGLVSRIYKKHYKLNQKKNTQWEKKNNNNNKYFTKEVIKIAIREVQTKTMRRNHYTCIRMANKIIPAPKKLKPKQNKIMKTWNDGNNDENQDLSCIAEKITK